MQSSGSASHGQHLSHQCSRVVFPTETSDDKTDLHPPDGTLQAIQMFSREGAAISLETSLGAVHNVRRVEVREPLLCAAHHGCWCRYEPNR